MKVNLPPQKRIKVRILSRTRLRPAHIRLENNLLPHRQVVRPEYAPLVQQHEPSLDIGGIPPDQIPVLLRAALLAEGV